MNRFFTHSAFHGLDMALLVMALGLFLLFGTAGAGSLLGLPLLFLGLWEMYAVSHQEPPSRSD